MRKLLTFWWEEWFLKSALSSQHSVAVKFPSTRADNLAAVAVTEQQSSQPKCCECWELSSTKPFF
jgi:hypothetical protein